MVTLVELINQTDPVVILLGGLGVSALLILWDEGARFSLSIPGSRRRLGLAGLVAIGSALLYKVRTGGVTSILDQIASDIIGFSLIGVIIIGVLFKMRR